MWVLSNEEKCVQRAEEHEEKFSTKKKGRGGIFSQKKKRRGERAPKTRYLWVKNSLTSESFPAAGCASLFFIRTREKTYVIHTHTDTHTHSRTRLAHALKTRKESLLKTIVIRRKDVSREEE